jgi:CHASE3 domain sensor protein
VIDEIDKRASYLKDAETGHGGFRIEGDPQFLHLDNAAIAGHAARMRAPGDLTADHPQQKETIASPEATGEARAPKRRHETASMPGDIPFHFAARIDT